jgi:hypothetical protein
MAGGFRCAGCGTPPSRRGYQDADLQGETDEARNSLKNRPMRSSIALLALTCFAAGCAYGSGSDTGAAAMPAWPGDGTAGPRSEPSTATYSVYVGAESADLIHGGKFGPEVARVARTFPVGEIAVETEGLHGFNMSRDGEYLKWTTDLGVRDGKLWQYHTGLDTLVGGPNDLGWFLALIDLTPDGLCAFVTNCSLDGQRVPSTVSAVCTPEMIEVDHMETCVMPFGLRTAPDGTHFYTNCMTNDLLVEVDTRTFQVSRYFSVAPGQEGPWEKPDHDGMHEMHHDGAAGHDMGEMGAGEGMAGMDHSQMGPYPMSNVCSPTWAEPSADGTKV